MLNASATCAAAIRLIWMSSGATEMQELG